MHINKNRIVEITKELVKYKSFTGEEKDVGEYISRFFEDMGLCGTEFFQTMELKETPKYLRSVRSGASFGASLTAGKREKSYFYITTDGKGEDFDAHRKKRFHREFRFLVAHETVPGHHFLDSIRRELDNPVRR